RRRLPPPQHPRAPLRPLRGAPVRPGRIGEPRPSRERPRRVPHPGSRRAALPLRGAGQLPGPRERRAGANSRRRRASGLTRDRGGARRGTLAAPRREPDRLRARRHLAAARPRAALLPIAARAAVSGPLMSFLTPAFLAGLAALGVPILIHLTHRPRSETVPFP